MDKIIVSIAPCKAGEPVCAEKLAEDVKQCANLGASMVHLHCRLPDGSLSADTSYMKKCFEKIGEKADLVFQASTGGVSDMNIKERCNPLFYQRVESASLNAGSTNMGNDVYINSEAEIMYCSKMIYEHKIIPDIEVFDIGMIHNIERLKTKNPFREPVYYNLVFGHLGGMQAQPEDLTAFRSLIPENARWGVTHYGRDNWTFLAMAIAMGASTVRIGFEDSAWISETKEANYNYQLMERLSSIIRAMGREMATPQEARRMMGVL